MVAFSHGIGGFKTFRVLEKEKGGGSLEEKFGDSALSVYFAKKKKVS